MPKEQRKQYGQFFTNKKVATFMASLFTIPYYASHLDILDPGAGTGILSAALLERLDKTSIKSVTLTCYV